ncbi:hypothetical protein [Pedobacter gandavensis]|uniref:hypothetical protein n=1 Tax=Pedobacter gandavensis TaxID=2679963 RepID=UPI00292EB02E|nr:hypothetical protein [Pedobacter gandavensis]
MSTISQPGSPDLSNIQGMVIRGFTHPYSCHMIFKFPDKPGAKNFIKAINPYVQSGESWGEHKPEMMINIGFTFTGISIASDLKKEDLGHFPIAFKQGPASPGSQQSLNDYGTSLSSNWVFGSKKTQVDTIVHCYALNDVGLNTLVTMIKKAADDNGLVENFPIGNGSKRLEEYVTDPAHSIHFGYLDGIDQPDLDTSIPIKDTSSLGNFLIGYAPNSDPGPSGNTAAGSFAKDGCYNAFRMLAQDEKVFDDFLNDNAQSISVQLKKDPAYAKEWLAAKLNGRWRNGSPLELSPEAPDPNTSHATDFDYSTDQEGLKCPFAAHNRVSNPRSDQLVDKGSIPRLLRRGMAYGAPPILNNYDGERGLIGLFLCGSLTSQFELIYSWISTTNFSVLTPPDQLQAQDALIANRAIPYANTSFTIPIPEGKVVINKLPQFVMTKGTSYCLLPSLSTLKEMAG